ncbi:MAG: VOC family protein [Mesorhizobium amorphae]|nr:MAG: VOC family protein [Mesorhizobium amorphae]
MRRIDHLVLAVRDLDEAAAFYAKLGFQVGARNRHPWGTENRLIQFGSSFIELITLGADAGMIAPHTPERFSFGAFVRDFLQTREGLAMLVLDSRDAKADAAAFKRAGLGTSEPFFFERKGQRPDGSQTHVAFTLAFATDGAAPDIGYFVCQQHYPENFWNPTLQEHPNGATAIAAVAMRALEPQAHRAFLAAFTGEAPEAQSGGGMSFALANGRVEVAPFHPTEAHPSARLQSLTVVVNSLQQQIERMRAAGIPFDERLDGLVVQPSAAAGVEIVLHEV